MCYNNLGGGLVDISINLTISNVNGSLVLTNEDKGIVCFTKDQVVQRKVSMVTLGELTDLPKIEIAKIFGYSTRKSYYDARNDVLNGTGDNLIPEPTGPRASPKRTRELEILVIQMRFDTNDSMYEITEKLHKKGFNVSPRLVGQILKDYGLSKKKPPQANPD